VDKGEKGEKQEARAGTGTPTGKKPRRKWTPAETQMLVDRCNIVSLSLPPSSSPLPLSSSSLSCHFSKKKKKTDVTPRTQHGVGPFPSLLPGVAAALAFFLPSEFLGPAGMLHLFSDESPRQTDQN
jgi:hypothetical protein